MHSHTPVKAGTVRRRKDPKSDLLAEHELERLKREWTAYALCCAPLNLLVQP